jgi:chemotaxis protein CheY-P-specific phosphatase CheC
MNLTLTQKEIVTRLIEAGVNRSTELLGRMSHTKWGIVTSSINEIPVVRLLSWYQRDDSPHVGARFKSRADVPLEFLILFPAKSSQSVTDAVTKPYAERMGKLPDLVKLTIGEVSNVLAQGVIGAVADEYDLTIILSVPEVVQGSKAEILSNVLGDYDGREDILMMSHIDMYAENLSADCSMIIVVNAESLRRILTH